MEHLKVSDAVWIATALLQRERGRDADFGLREILERARKEDPKGADRPGLNAHVVSHAVADRPPDPGKYRMLHTTARGRRRLFRSGDPVHPGRTGKTHPHPDEIPQRYRSLIDWYEQDYNRNSGAGSPVQPQAKPPSGSQSNGASLFRFWGIMTKARAQEYQRIVEEGCERIEP